MFDESSSDNSQDQDQAFDLLQELGRNTTAEIQRQRAHFRRVIKTSVVVQSGNASDLFKFKLKGVTGDISEGGCSGLFPLPLRVGDIYRLEFDRQNIDLPLTFTRCVRCRLVREDAYEAGFAFFKPIVLPTRVDKPSAALVH